MSAAVARVERKTGSSDLLQTRLECPVRHPLGFKCTGIISFISPLLCPPHIYEGPTLKGLGERASRSVEATVLRSVCERLTLGTVEQTAVETVHIL